jgi:adenine-specific DNA-methyltransferase
MNNERVRKKDSARLVWDSKPRRAPNPKDIEFQTAEVVIPNPRRDGEQIPISFRDGLLGESEIDKSKMNRLIWGDNLLAMQALLAQGYEGRINLIYIDPPFDSKADYSHKMTIEGNEFTKEPSVIERLAYKDTWSGGTDSYLDMLYPRLQLMKRLLAEDGSIYVHLDWHVGHYVKVMMDEIYGIEHFTNEIIWKRKGGSANPQNKLGVVTDSIFWFSKTEKAKFNQQYSLESDEVKKYIEERFNNVDEKGRRFMKSPIVSPNPRPNLTYEYKGYIPPKNGWSISREIMEQWDKEGRLYFPPRNIGDRIYRKIYLDEYIGQPTQNLWMDIFVINPVANERLDFDTQKPSALLERIIKISTEETDFVADFFAGSGTTLAVAEKLGRHWIGCELGKVGIQVTRARLVEQGAKPFLIENIGNYQREMIYLTGGRIWEMQHLILKLYGATPRDKTSGLGVRNVEGTEELVYVGYPDRPITAKKAEELAIQAQKLDGRGYKRLVILGWDYEYNYQEALEARKNALKDKLKVQIESRDIPPDIYDYLKKAKTEEEIESLADKVRFYERPYLRMNEPKVTDLKDGKVQIDISIKRYVLMDIPVSHTSKTEQETYNSLMKLAKDNFAVLIDYWAVDWDYDGFTFKSLWQTFRGNGKKAKTVPITANETLEKKKNRVIAVRVVDIFGNDAGATMELRT